MCSSPQTAATPFSTDAVPPQTAREPSRFAQAVVRVESCLIFMHKITEQMGALVEQRRKLHDELRGIQCQMNEEFDRILRPARASGPCAAPKVVTRATPADGDATPPLRMGSRSESRLELLEAAAESTARVAS